MPDHTAFCSACDRDVPVLARERHPEADAARRHASGAFLCLDYGSRCTGAMCPLMAVPVTEEDRRRHAEAVLDLHRAEQPLS